jgi:hypothetical protein
VCGDHHFNPHASEQCDTASPGNNSDTGACTTACEIAVCGDGFIEAGTEQCDDPTHATSCAYNAAPSTCTVCDPVTCQHTSGTAHFCGDGQLDADFEVCDDKNSTCGTCSADCRISQSAAAQGLIFAPAGNQLVSGTDTFTLNDGFLPTVTFEFNTGTVSDGNVKVPFLSTDTNVQVATKIATAISVNGNLGINATSMGPIVVLVNQRFSTLGNGTSSSHKIVESVASSAFAVIDMTGGLGGDCGVGQACADNEDCASELCVSGLCTPP